MRKPLLVIALLLLAGCSSSLAVDEYPMEPDTAVNCHGLYADVPPTVADQDAVIVKDDVAAAWGDPPIILRCGVEKPDDLGPAARCDVVADIGWFTEKIADGYLFTTIGRRFNISVEVPKDYDPAADALVDLADVITRHDPVDKPCV